ncbi:hypothetical protein GCM10010913_48190 [Paenibacillus aceti]|uniref:Uncharacterized protein n=1 Tax=Paenibacillus aceti TaxID=1820010 RepID=A0ABQ1W8H7_9BACL|nr:hypothetical protein GCM10010913_48190 [Paenibacillus aceti]
MVCVYSWILDKIAVVRLTTPRRIRISKKFEFWLSKERERVSINFFVNRIVMKGSKALTICIITLQIV